MLRSTIAWVREWIAVEDAEERIEGTGEAITSPQHKRSAEADRTLEEASEGHRRDEP
ncbi:hypothetical protein OB905_12465 [Halobacteria archaeon AArc-dxtr1]|nr:hypothetical protein [Halobacteria archaeon AArc-dxtr1]